MGPQASKILNILLKFKLNGYKLPAHALSSPATYFSREEGQDSPQISRKGDVPLIFLCSRF